MVTHKICGFAFAGNNISSNTLYKLKGVEEKHLLWGNESIEKFVESLVKSQPKYILGLGIFSHSGKFIKIETHCSNKFRGNLRKISKVEEIEIKPYLQPLSNSIYAKSIGTSYCNMVSYKIMNLIKSGKLKSKYTFLHIPRNMKVEVTAPEIDKMLEQIIAKDF